MCVWLQSVHTETYVLSIKLTYIFSLKEFNLNLQKKKKKEFNMNLQKKLICDREICIGY